MKITLEQSKKGQELYTELIQKAWESNFFKNQLIVDPKATISEYLGKDYHLFEDGKKLIVEDQTNDSFIYFNIPPKPNLDDLELTDEELMMISGGEGPLTLAAGIGYVVGFAVGSAAVYLAGKYLF